MGSWRYDSFAQEKTAFSDFHWSPEGGHALGSGSDVLYTPDGFIKKAVSINQPVIWVAINYRLGCES
jgi:hypothetical protein